MNNQNVLHSFLSVTSIQVTTPRGVSIALISFLLIFIKASKWLSDLNPWLYPDVESYLLAFSKQLPLHVASRYLTLSFSHL